MILDIVIVLFILIMAVVSYKEGLINSILGLVGFIAALIIAWILFKPVSSALINTALLPKIEEVVLATLNNMGDLMTSSFPTAEMLAETLSSSFPLFIAKPIADAIIASGIPSGITLAAAISPVISRWVFDGIVFISLFIIILIVIKILKTIGHTINNIPLVGFVNRLLGFGFGMVKGLLIIYIFLLILTFALNIPFLAFLKEQLYSSTLSLYLYNNNLIGKLFVGIFG